MRKILTLFILFTSLWAESQTTLNCRLLDSLTKNPVAFANIGFLSKGLGTVSDEKGYFQLSIPDSLKNAEIKISCIGYKAKILYSKDLSQNTILYLASSISNLNEVTVSAKKNPKIKMLGNNNPSNSIIGAFASNDLGTEVAIKINIKHQDTRLKKLKFSMNSGPYDSVMFRFNVYAIDASGKPGNNILKQMVLIKPASKKGDFEFDISQYNIVVNDNIFIALEWIKGVGKMKNKTDYMTFASKIFSGGTYVRKESQDNWYKLEDGGLRFGFGLSVEAEY